jgi:putative tryptophan/tyrosine transport system substrate-binding protein
MRRREFIALVGGVAATWPLAARAQQQLPVIGYLGSSPSIDRPRAAAFVKRLSELGWVSDRNVRIELRWAEASAERAREVAAEFVRLKVDVIMTYGSVNVSAAKQATATIPIVFVAGDPVGTGLVESLARPGGNATGLSLEVTGTASKRLALLREIVPSLRQLAIAGNVAANNSAKAEMNEAQTAARTFGLEVIVSELHRPEDIDPAIEALRGRADALYICADPFVTTNETHINSSALSAGLPTMYGLPENAAAGGLLAYGVDFLELCRRAAEIVDKVLRGANPANIPVEQPTTFKFVINLKTAKALGLTVPYSMQLLADEVIE